MLVNIGFTPSPEDKAAIDFSEPWYKWPFPVSRDTVYEDVDGCAVVAVWHTWCGVIYSYARYKVMLP